jgi:AraC-like DNA-binding protein
MNKILDTVTTAADGKTVRAGLVQHILLTIVANSGTGEAELLAAAGLSREALADPDERIPSCCLEKLVCAGARLSSDPLLALHASETADLSGFGVIGFLQQACSTVQETIEMIQRYEHLLSDSCHTTLQYQPGTALWCFECDSGNAEFSRHASEFMLGCWRQGFRQRPLQRHVPILRAVHFRHEPPADSALFTEYERIFGCPVHFRQAVTALELPLETLKMPLAHPDAGIQEALEQHARRLLERSDKPGSLLERARTQLRVLLHNGCASRDMLAENLGISARHLHRQLQREGVTYNQLLDRLRLELAHSYLANSSDSIATVAERLQFIETQSFIRWFRQMTGETPRKYRQGLGEQS